VRNVLVDAGKFFYQSAIEMFPRFKVRTLDAVVLTHAHADAAGGLDDLRDWTNNNKQVSIPVFYRPEDQEALARTHYYLVERSNANTAGTIAKLLFSQIGRERFEAAGIGFIPLPVWHGRPVSANGYRFGGVCYVPDVSEFPYETRPLIQGCDLLVIDALRPRRTHGSHLTLEQAVDQVRKLRPRQALLTGMCHEVVHDETDAWLKEVSRSEGLEIGLAYDGLAIDVEL
jgi:phosphoribosyl 1,2-cyclic phosphodiesterase